MSVTDKIQHYQRSIEKSNNDEERILRCIKKLYSLPVTVQHLQETGVGRTVNALRKYEGSIGDASKALVAKWKAMVANEETSDGEDENEIGTSNASMDYDHATHSEAKLDSSLSIHNNKEKNEKLKYSDHHSLKTEPLSDEENHKCKQEMQKEDNDSKHDKYKIIPSQNEKKRSSSHKENKNSLSRNNESSIKYEQKNLRLEILRKDGEKDRDSSSKRMAHNERDKSKRKLEGCSSTEKVKRLKNPNETVDQSEEGNTEHSQSINQTEQSEIKIKQEPACFLKKESNMDIKNVTKYTDEEGFKAKISNKSSHSEKSKHSSVSKEKDKTHKSSKKSDSKRDKHSSSRDHKNDKAERSEKSDKNSKSSKSIKSDGNEKIDKDKQKQSVKGQKSRDSQQFKEPKKVKLKKEIGGDEGIDCNSGTSFAEALGMCSAVPAKKRVSNSQNSSSSRTVKFEQVVPTETKLESTSSENSNILPLLKPNINLEPLSVDLASTLPEISPNYKPLPYINPVQRKCEEKVLTDAIYVKNQRTKVYSGNKTGYTSVPSLYETCMRVLIANIDALEFTGGVPYDILKPVLEHATPDQLFMLEHYNPYLIEDTDVLWQLHAKREFRNMERQEMESWREMYMRCLDEREAKLKALTNNIKQSIDKSLPVRSTKLAYVDNLAKPPRSVLKKQAKFGTARALPVSTSNVKHKLITGNGSITPMPPSAVRVKSVSSTGGVTKKTKAPLMAKALQLIKRRYKR
ncbi:transcription elongation factor B polypeptide 3 [Prorops nasuta]|uniref:transcription elongation factor B polypeptide 3 n=1 Tax=Prorops nasuta TaxID=863751 RepID=UPI0034CD9265